MRKHCDTCGFSVITRGILSPRVVHCSELQREIYPQEEKILSLVGCGRHKPKDSYADEIVEETTIKEKILAEIRFYSLLKERTDDGEEKIQIEKILVAFQRVIQSPSQSQIEEK